MQLRVRLFAVLAEVAGAREITLDGLPETLTIGDVKREIERRVPTLGPLTSIAGVVGTTYAKDDHVVRAGDDVSLLPPVSGGAADDDAALERGLFFLESEPLDVAALSARVTHPSCGAVCTFVGVTRDNNRGAVVVRLDYEAFDAMTGPEMARIFARCRDALGGEVVRMVCAHRTGTVAVGEPSVVIATASAHRDAAFQATRFLIDELKRTLPIWKKEVYADGHHWIGDRS